MPLNVTISVVENENKILLLKRKKGLFSGMLGLPGGKIENGERIKEAAIREIEEETKIKSKFDGIHGVILERLVEKNKVKNEFLIFLSELKPYRIPGPQPNCVWLDMNDLESCRDSIIPSDYEMINQIFVNKKPGYYESIIIKSRDKYKLQSFERINHKE